MVEKISRIIGCLVLKLQNKKSGVNFCAKIGSIVLLDSERLDLATYSMIDVVKFRSSLTIFTEIELGGKISKPITSAVY